MATPDSRNRFLSVEDLAPPMRAAILTSDQHAA
jgi:hypothetical protein